MPAERRLSQLRSTPFPLVQHNHGKTKVRVLKVKKNPNDNVHHVFEYSVTTILHSNLTRVFTDEDNTGLVATDTQKNIVYIVAKKTSADSPEQFGTDLCLHFLKNYPQLTGVEAEVIMTKWKRVTTDENDSPHPHGFEKSSPEVYTAHVRTDRNDDNGVGLPPKVTGCIKNMTVLKTTQSGFENYHVDGHTLLKSTKERCLATELECTWIFDEGVTTRVVDYVTVRETVRKLIIKGFYGPRVGVYSVSLQATIYDIACLILRACPEISSVKIFTPNLHYLPMTSLNLLGDKFENDIFLPTDEPSGIISCTVSQKDDISMMSRL